MVTGKLPSFNHCKFDLDAIIDCIYVSLWHHIHQARNWPSAQWNSTYFWGSAFYVLLTYHLNISKLILYLLQCFSFCSNDVWSTCANVQPSLSKLILYGICKECILCDTFLIFKLCSFEFWVNIFYEHWSIHKCQ